MFNDPLTGGPKLYAFEWVVEPAGGDAEVGVMWCHVVDPMVPPRQNDMHPLQPLDPGRQMTVRVRPLVDLVCEGDKETEGEESAVDKEPGTDALG